MRHPWGMVWSFCLLIVLSTFQGSAQNTIVRGSPLQAGNVASTQADTWSDVGGGVGTDGSIKCSAVDAAGNLYVGGFFTTIAGAPANCIAKWDGVSWTALGSGTNQTVFSIEAHGNDIYVGGSFTLAGGLPVKRIAKWDGSNWSQLGGSPNVGFDDAVYALRYWGGSLYIGGYFTGFTDAANVFTSMRGIACWDGSNVRMVGAGFNGAVLSLAAAGSDLYAGGAFTASNGDATTFNYIAKWNGSAWSALGSSPVGVDGIVETLAWDCTNLFVGGWFANAGGIPSQSCARWDGSAWHAIGGFSGGSNLYTLVAIGKNVYAGGQFTIINSELRFGIARWDGSAWFDVGGGVRGGYPATMAFKPFGGTMFVLGNFSSVGGLSVTASQMGSFTTTDIPPILWSNAAGTGGTDGIIRAVASDMSGNVYVGGDFTTIMGVAANHIAKWDGATWTALGSGLTRSSGLTTVRAILVDGTNIYAGGIFDASGGTPIHNVGVWNGSSWSGLGGDPTWNGTYGPVNALAKSGSNLIVAGALQQVYEGSAPFFRNVGSVASWNGTTWSTLSGGVPQYSSSEGGNALIEFGAKIYLGGKFNTGSGAPSAYLASYDGASWSVLAGGELDGVVRTLATDGTRLFVGGDFTQANGSTVDYIAQWNGSLWTALGSPAGVNSGVYSLTVSGNHLYVGGDFSAQSGGGASYYLARFDIAGDSWSALGGANSTVYATGLDIVRGRLFAGGDFSIVNMENSGSELSAGKLAFMTDAQNPLPIQLASFGVRQTAAGASLVWSTISEVNNFGFSIERRRADEATFTGIPNGFIAGHGTTNAPQQYMFVDGSVTSGSWYYRLKQIDIDRSVHFSEPVKLDVTTGITATAPVEFGLMQNYPNPFNPSTTIGYGLPARSHVRLTVYNSLGQQVAVLQNGEQEAGYHEIRFDASNLSSGAYFYRIQSEGLTQTKRLLLTR